MLRKIIVEDLTDVLNKPKSIFQKIFGDSKQVKTLKSFVDKAKSKRAIELESKEDIDLLDEIYLAMKAKKEKLKSSLAPGGTIENIINFKMFSKGIDSSVDSRIHQFFGTHKNAQEQPINNHRFGSPNVVNHVKKFLVGPGC